MEHLVFYLIIAIIIIDFTIEQVLDNLNATYRKKPIPDKLKNIYDKEKYAKQQHYSKINSKFSMLTSSFSFLLIILFLFIGGFATLNNYLSENFENQLVIGLLFFAILYFANDLLALPFTIYDTFVIEQKFGFNKTTPKLFLTDKLKSYLITILIGGGLYALIFVFYKYTEQYFWIYCWLAITVIMFFFTMFYSNIIVPLFNKQKPLSNENLKTTIEKFSQKVGFQLDNIFEIDGSKRSSRANAYFTGIGPKKRIVLYDNLINQLSENEIIAVLAHEIGHYKHKHTTLGMFVSLLQIGLMLFILSLFIGNPLFSKALGVDVPTFHISLITFALLYSPISTVTGLFMNIWSRKNEYQADAFAKKHSDAQALISALKKLAENNLSNLTPHPFYVWINYSHPTILQRIEKLEN